MPVVVAEDLVPLVQADEGDPKSARTFGNARVAFVFGALGLVAGSCLVARHHRPMPAGEVADRIEDVALVSERSCAYFFGLQLAQDDADKTSLWPECAEKWSMDCSQSGCCQDWGMKCYRKNDNWAACMETCDVKEKKKGYNETWSCAVVEPPTPRTSESCMQSCKETDDCKQVVFNSDGGGSCISSEAAINHVAWAGDNINSSICGTGEEMASKESDEFVSSVWKQVPFEIEWPRVNCSWGGEDCSGSKCCNDYICDKNYDNCFGYQCFAKNEYFAGCAAQPAEGWDGTVIGYPREHRVIPAAGSQVAVQGNSLYCFTVVTWNAPSPKPFWNSEAEIANLWKSKGLHVLQCDGSDIIDGIETPRAEWGSFSNIDMFLEVWKKVYNIGTWERFDWTIKVDSDAVFIPSRLKDHLYNLRTPLGARVYLENIDFKFKFMGAIEILSREAARTFMQEGRSCVRGEHAGGEDSFTKGCLDGLGVDHQIDHAILRDRYANMNGACNDGWFVAYHYMKKCHDWARCYNEVICGDGCEAGPCCDGAIEVPHPPGWAE